MIYKNSCVILELEGLIEKEGLIRLESADKLFAHVRIDKTVAELREALSGEYVEKIKTKNEELAKVFQEVGTIVYQQAPARQVEREKTEQAKGPKERVVDTDYEEVKEERKE